MTTFLDKVHRFARGRAVASTVEIRNRDDCRNLSYYTLCALSDTMTGNPFAMQERGEVWAIDLDAEGNFLAARKTEWPLLVESGS